MVSSLPSVSVVIATYNSELFIAQAIDSIISQDYLGDLEIIISDDGSTDRTVNLVEAIAIHDHRVKLIKSQKNIGSASARNAAIDFSISEYVAIQDSDDFSKPERLRTQIEVLEQDKSISFASSGHFLFDQQGLYKLVTPSTGIPGIKDLLWGPPFCHAATVFRRDALVSVGMYRVAKETRRSQDYDLFLRLYAKGHFGINISEPLYFYRVDRATLSRRKFKYRLHEIVIRWKGFKELNLLPGAIFYVVKPIFAHLNVVALRLIFVLSGRR